MAALPMPSDTASKRWYHAREVISRTAELLCADQPLPALFEQLCPMLAEFVEADRVFIALSDGGTAGIETLFENGKAGRPDDPARYAAPLERVTSTGHRLVTKGGKHGPADALRTGDHPNAAESAIYVPLKFGCSTIGVLGAQRDRPDAYDDEDVRLLESCASFLALRVHDAGVAAEAAALRSMASVDQLTGIANRRAFEKAFDVEWRRSARDRVPLALILVDVDLFKSFNDHCGHIAGDACLRQVASAMAQCLRRPADHIARYGGEEFAIVLPGTTLTGALTVAERLRSAVNALNIVHSGSLLGVVSISAGAASALPEPASDAGELVRSADHALYRAKAGGRNRVVGEDYVSGDARVEPRTDRLHNLPAPLTDFLGRERELEELRALLKSDRLVTIVGAGGAGKTRLALRAGELAFGSFRDGVWFADLSTVERPADLSCRIRSALSLSDADANPAIDRVLRHLRQRELMLLLDNCEHIADACAEFVRQVLAEAPAVRVLATSRQALRVYGEATLRLGGMPWPKRTQDITVEKALRYEGVRLFERRARSVGQFMLTDQNVAAVVELCSRLDGIPLALELAAARTALMSVEDVAAGMAERFELLDNGDRSGPRRQHTLRALIQWSYDLLAEHERTMLRRLSVFSGSCTLAAAEQVAALDPGEAGVTAGDALAALVEKSLLSVDREADQPRFHLLESTRAFAAEQLGDTEAARATRERHARFFAELACEADAAYGTRGWQASSRLLSRERDNLRAALQFTLDEANDAATGARMATALCQWWHEAGLPLEGRRWIKRALAMSDALDQPTHARLWYALARVHIGEAGDDARSEAIAASECAAKMFAALGDERMTGRSFQLAAKFYTLLGDLDRAEAAARNAIEHAQTCGDMPCRATALNNLGVIANYRGDHDKAIALEEQALAIFESIDDEFGVALATGNIADSAWALGDFDRAAALFRRTLSINERGKNRFNVGLALSNLAGAEAARGNHDMAIPLLLDAMDVVEAYRDHWLLTAVMSHLARALVDRGSFVRVAALVGVASAAHERAGVPWSSTEKRAYDVSEKAARQALGDARYEEVFSAGRSWDLEQALTEARRVA